MNQQQKKYTIERLNAIATIYFKKLVKSDNVADSEYKQSTTLNLEDLLANDRALLLKLQPKENADVDASLNNYFSNLFDLAEATAEKKAKSTVSAPDTKNRTSIRYPDDSSYHVFSYCTYRDEAQACKDELVTAIDAIMIGSDSTALAALEQFTKRFG